MSIKNNKYFFIAEFFTWNYTVIGMKTNTKEKIIMSKTIMLACAGGMSTSLLVTKMRESATKRNIDVNIFATASAAIPEESEKHEPAVILLGPQIKFQLNQVKKEVNVPVAVIDMKDYGMMNGENVLTQALSMIK